MSTSSLALRHRSTAMPAFDVVPLVLLTMATSLATVWAVSAAGWNDGTTIALATTAVAVAEAALIASSTGGRLVAAVSAPVLGVLVIVPLTIGGMSAGGDGMTGVRHVAARYAHGLTVGILDSDSWSFNVGLCAGMWLLAFWAGWLVVRERRGMLAVLPCYAVLAVNALNAPSPGGVALPDAVALGASLLLIARAHLASLETSWRRGRVVALPGTRRRFTSVALTGAVLAVLVGVVFPPATTADISGRIFHFTVGDLGRGSGSGSGPGSGGGGAPATISFSPNTVPGGPLIDDPRPAFAYTTNSSEDVYLRVVDDTIFDNGNWFPRLNTGQLTRVDVNSGTISRDRSAAHGADVVPSRRVDINVVLDTAAAHGSDDHPPFAGEPEAVNRTAAAFGFDGAAVYPDADRSQSLVTVDLVTVRTPFVDDPSVVTGGAVPTATEAQLNAAGTDYPAWVRAAGLFDVDASNPAAQGQLADIAALARSWAAPAPTIYDKARAIEAHLRATPFTYTLSPPATPPGELPIHAFLLSTHRGYCQYYASSMGTMLRLLGIPTRLVSGYGAGTSDDSAGNASRLHHVSSSDAHVWVEAYFPKYGWIPFEPTPSTQYGDYQPIPRPGASASATPTPAGAATPTPAAATPSPSPTASAAGAAGAVVTGPTIPPALLGSTLGALAVAALVVTAVLWLRRPSRQATLWRRMRLVGRLLGVRKRAAESEARFAARMMAAIPGDGTSFRHRDGSGVPTGRRVQERTVEALSTISVLSSKAAFSRHGLEDEEEVRWRRAWGRVCRALPVVVWRRLIARPAGPSGSSSESVPR